MLFLALYTTTKSFFQENPGHLAVLLYFGHPSGNYFCQNFLQCIVITYAYVLGLFIF